MLKNMKGVTFEKNSIGNCHLCVVDDFSLELADEIRKNLVSICHGPYRAKHKKSDFRYKSTVGEFIKLCRNMDTPKKKGIVGELLAHILIKNRLAGFRPISMLFNMEEKSFTKGFDLLFASGNSSKLWIAEVKSGGVGNKKVSEKHYEFINKGKNDLLCRLSDQEEYRWRKSLNALDIIRKNRSEKKKIEKILALKMKEAYDGEPSSGDVNVILVSTVYSKSKDNIIKEMNNWITEISSVGNFSDVVLVCVTKETYSKVFSFLKREST